MNKLELSDYYLQLVRKCCNIIKTNILDKDSQNVANKLLNAVSLVQSSRRSSLEYLLPSETTLEVMAQDSNGNPSLYYYFRYFETSITICCNADFIIQGNRLKPDDSNICYHIKVVGTLPRFKEVLREDLPYYYQSGLKKFSYHLFGNFDTLHDALPYFRMACFDVMLQYGLKGVEYGLL